MNEFVHMIDKDPVTSIRPLSALPRNQMRCGGPDTISNRNLSALGEALAGYITIPLLHIESTARSYNQGYKYG